MHLNQICLKSHPMQEGHFVQVSIQGKKPNSPNFIIFIINFAINNMYFEVIGTIESLSTIKLIIVPLPIKDFWLFKLLKKPI